VAREILRAAGIPYQLFDALPLGAEPYAAALDTVFSCISSSFARVPAIALLRSPHFAFRPGPAEAGRYDPGHDVVSARDIVALDRALSESGYLGDVDALDRLVASWRASAPATGRLERALRAADLLQEVVRALLPARSPASVSDHLSVILEFLTANEHLPGPDDPLRARQLRARGAILGTIRALRDAYGRFDTSLVPFDEAAALVRRWIEGQTFAPRAGESGVHVVDAASAPFGDFDHVQLAGVVDGEWPDRPRRNIFYSTAILRDLGWPAESDRLAGARAGFADLLRLPASRIVASTFLLEADSLVGPSPFVDEIEEAQLDAVEEPAAAVRIFDYEALDSDPLDTLPVDESVRSWVAFRRASPPADDRRFRGTTSAHVAPAYSLSALERYQDCPFKYFASDVLRLEETPEDDEGLSPRARGRFVHEVFQQFFQAWDARGPRTITPDRVDEARALCGAIAEPLLARLPEADASLERTRLFGSAISVGMADVVLGLEASRPLDVRDRWLEYRLEGDFSLGATDGRRVPLKGVADRIDLVAGNRLRIVDYKTGSAPNARRALQVPIYALCAQERLAGQDGAPWDVEDAAYIVFTGRRSLVSVVKPGGSDASEVLGAARARLFELVDGISAGEFPPRPHDPMICRYCAYSTVCRKDYVDDD
jgi:ATP-dependent helicase/nuclease subunit B